MKSGAKDSKPTQEETMEGAVYDPPKLVVLGTLAELTQLGNAPPDELLNDGSQA